MMALKCAWENEGTRSARGRVHTVLFLAHHLDLEKIPSFDLFKSFLGYIPILRKQPPT